MNLTTSKRRIWLPLGAAMGLAVATWIAYPNVAAAWDVKVTLTGEQEVPPVKTAGTGTGTASVGGDHSVKGSVTTRDIKGTAAHIHEAPAGKNGPVIIPLDEDGDTYKVPANTRLTDAQFASCKAGNLYVNVHTAAHPDGELRAQLKP